MVYRESPFQDHFFEVTVAQGIPQVLPDTQQDDVSLEVTPLEWVLWVPGRVG